MDALKNGWSCGSHHTKSPPYQNGCSPKNFFFKASMRLNGLWVIQVYVPQTTAMAFAFSSVFILLLWSCPTNQPWWMCSLTNNRKINKLFQKKLFDQGGWSSLCWCWAACFLNSLLLITYGKGGDRTVDQHSQRLGRSPHPQNFQIVS